MVDSWGECQWKVLPDLSCVTSFFCCSLGLEWSVFYLQRMQTSRASLSLHGVFYWSRLFCSGNAVAMPGLVLTSFRHVSLLAAKLLSFLICRALRKAGQYRIVSFSRAKFSCLHFTSLIALRCTTSMDPFAPFAILLGLSSSSFSGLPSTISTHGKPGIESQITMFFGGCSERWWSTFSAPCTCLGATPL